MGPPATRSTSKCNNAQVKPGARPRGSRARNGAGGHRPGATLPYGLNPLKPAPTPWPQVYLCVALTTLATLLLELSLTRIFSVVFYYHFAFLAISIALFANFPTLFMGLVGEDGGLEHYAGKLRFLDAGGHVVADYADTTYPDFLAEIAHPWSYLKTSFYKPLGYPDGVYRVGPLARMNIIDGISTPRAGQEWAEFRDLDRGAVLSSFYYHYARLIEIVYALEKIEQLLGDPDALDTNVRAHASVNKRSEEQGI